MKVVFRKNIVFLQKNTSMNLTQEDWISQLEADENAVILDVRTEDEFNDGYIANAINIDFNNREDFLNQIERLDPNKEYYVYCRSGMRSQQACNLMNNIGIENAYNLLGGILDWEGDVVQP